MKLRSLITLVLAIVAVSVPVAQAGKRRATSAIRAGPARQDRFCRSTTASLSTVNSSAARAARAPN